MDSPSGRHLLLAGETQIPGHGVWATVSCESLSGLNDGSEQEAFQRTHAEAFLAAPFFRLVGAHGERRLVVGQARIAVAPEAEPEVTLALQGVWSESGGWHQLPSSADHANDQLIASLNEPAHAVGGSPPSMAVIMGKAFAEASRNDILKVRALRYDLERQLADLLSNRKNTALRPLLSQIIELSLAVGRARDQAREAVREGLWIWLWDNETYRHNRAEHPPDERPVSMRESTHRAAVRQCEAMEGQLAEEAASLHSLLASMSTFAVAQDGEAQERFNLIVAVAAAGLGIPALILALYGADSFLPLNSFDYAWRALLPIGITSLIAAALAIRHLPGAAGPRRYAFAVFLVVALVAMLLFAGALAPGN